MPEVDTRILRQFGQLLAEQLKHPNLPGMPSWAERISSSIDEFTIWAVISITEKIVYMVPAERLIFARNLLPPVMLKLEEWAGPALELSTNPESVECETEDDLREVIERVRREGVPLLAEPATNGWKMPDGRYDEKNYLVVPGEPPDVVPPHPFGGLDPG